MKRHMLLHELHPAVVHMPIALIPVAAVSDLVAVVSGRPGWDTMARRLWIAGTASALFTGVTGLAASQQVRLADEKARQMTWFHGLVNVLVTSTALGITLFRCARRPTGVTAALGVASTAAVFTTATIGGKMVYEHGVGINPMPADAAAGTLRGPLLLSWKAPRALIRDALGGLRWLALRGQVATRTPPSGIAAHQAMPARTATRSAPPAQPPSSSGS